MKTISNEELVGVIQDFLEMGYVDNIVAMFHRYPEHYLLTGSILDDERFNVRLGVSVLFEELKLRQPDQTALSIPSLLPLLKSDQPHIRGEALSVLGIIGGTQALEHIKTMTDDEQPQVREMASEILQDVIRSMG